MAKYIPSRNYIGSSEIATDLDVTGPATFADTVSITSSSVTDFLKLISGGSSANPVKLIFEKSGAEQGVIEYNRNGDLEIYNTDGDGGVMISGSASADPDFYISHAGASTFKSTLTVGVDDTGHDVIFYGATASHYAMWDESKDLFQVAGDLEIKNANGSNPADAGSLVFNESGATWSSDMYGFRITLEGSANELKIQSANTSTVKEILKFARDTATSTFSGPVTVGVDDTGHDVIFYGATSGRYLQWDESDDSLKFRDNVKAKFGNGNDLALHHSGSQSEIKNLTGNLIIENTADDADIIFKTDDGSGGTTTYLTLDGGFSTPQVRIPDNVTFSVGDSQDLRLEHDGSDSRITQGGTGDLIIRQTVDDADLILQCDDGSGGSTAYITLDGGLGFTQAQKKIRFIDNVPAEFGSQGDFTINHNGSHLTMNNSVGNITIRNYTDDGDIIFESDDGSGGVEVYFRLDGSAGGSDPVTRWPDSSRIQLGTSGDADLYHDGTDTYFYNSTGDLKIINYADDKDIIFQSDNGSGGVTTYLTLDGGFSVPYVALEDSTILALGTHKDLLLAHDGTDSKIDNMNTGDLKIRNFADDKDIIFQSDDGSGGTATYFYLDGSVGFNRFPYPVIVEDSVNFNLGTGQDMQLLHNGSDSKIDNNTGDLYITNNTNDKDIILRSDDGSGGVTAYLTLDGSAGYTTVQKQMAFADDVKATFGSGNDLQLYHDGTNSYIRNTAAGHIYIQNRVDDKDIIFQSDDGSGGVTEYLRIDGSAGHTVANKDIYLVDDVRLRAGTSGDFSFFHDGSNSKINNNTGNIRIENFQDDGDISFYTDDGSGGTTEYLRIDGGATQIVASKDIYVLDNIKLRAGNAGDLYMLHNGTNSFLQNETGNLSIINYADDGDIIFQSDDGSGGVETYFFLDGSASSGNPYTTFPDNSLLSFGTGRDFIINHNGSNTNLGNYTGDLEIVNYANDKDVIFKSDDQSGGTETYFFLDGSTGQTRFPDGKILALGTGGDLRIQHDSNNSYISQEGTGDLFIRNTTDDKDILLQTDNGSGGVTSYIQLDGSDLSTKILTQKLIISNLPTSDPGVDGQVWNNSGVLNISSG